MLGEDVTPAGSRARRTGRLGDGAPLTLVVPLYNEAGRFARFACELTQFISTQARGSTLLFVDDGSHDGTADLARRLRRVAAGWSRRTVGPPSPGEGRGRAIGPGGGGDAARGLLRSRSLHADPRSRADRRRCSPCPDRRDRLAGRRIVDDHAPSRSGSGIPRPRVQPRGAARDRARDPRHAVRREGGPDGVVASSAAFVQRTRLRMGRRGHRDRAAARHPRAGDRDRMASRRRVAGARAARRHRDAPRPPAHPRQP